jgi:hypothetical protein
VSGANPRDRNATRPAEGIPYGPCTKPPSASRGSGRATFRMLRASGRPPRSRRWRQQPCYAVVGMLSPEVFALAVLAGLGLTLGCSGRARLPVEHARLKPTAPAVAALPAPVVPQAVARPAPTSTEVLEP